MLRYLEDINSSLRALYLSIHFIRLALLHILAKLVVSVYIYLSLHSLKLFGDQTLLETNFISIPLSLLY